MESICRVKVRKGVKIVIVGLLLTGFIKQSYAQDSCGTLKCVFNGAEARIRWYPASFLNQTYDFVFDIGHRWLRNGSALNLSGRITFDNTSQILSIHNFTARDGGNYQVQCRFRDEFRFSETLYVGLPNGTTQQTTTPEYLLTTAHSDLAESQVPASKKTGIDDSVAIVIVSLCVVIIVVVISATVVLVCRRRMQKEEDHQRLAEMTESPPTSRADGDGASVYNEIDVEYESTQSRYIIQGLSCSRIDVRSPSLPKRPGPAGQHSLAENTAKKNIAVENEYAEITDKQAKLNTNGNTDLVPKDIKDMYSKVVPKDQRANKVKVTTAEYSYAKPVPKKDRQANGQTERAEAGRYSVTFPKIDMAKLQTTMGAPDADLVSLNEENFDAAICRGGVFRSQRRKSSKNQLTYIEVEHVNQEGHTLIPRLAAPQDKLEYVSIDFEKKAFVAPARRAPSSWYKRKNRKKRY